VHCFLQVRINLYDRAPMRSTGGDIEAQHQLYAALRAFGYATTRAPDAIARVALKPGQLLLIDKWRLLHGRTAFEGGERHVCGCYVGRTDYMSAARVLGLVP